jgi:hypothetical protein
MSHTITPAFKVTKDVDERLRLGFKVQAGIGIGTNTEKARNESRTITEIDSLVDNRNVERYLRSTAVANQTETERNTFSLAPEFLAGVQYRLIPDRFTLNGGISAGFTFARTSTRISPQGFNYTIDYERDGYGNVLKDDDYTAALGGNQIDRLTISRNFNDLTASLSGGFTFYFTPTFSADAAFGGFLTNATDWQLDLTTVSILFTLKK